LGERTENSVALSNAPCWERLASDYCGDSHEAISGKSAAAAHRDVNVQRNAMRARETAEGGAGGVQKQARRMTEVMRRVIIHPFSRPPPIPPPPIPATAH
jgi:hypothetical protein